MNLSGAVLQQIAPMPHRQARATFTDIWTAIQTSANCGVLDGIYAVAAQSVFFENQPITWFKVDFGHKIFIRNVSLLNAGLQDTAGVQGRACQMTVYGSQDMASFTSLFTVVSTAVNSNLSGTARAVNGFWRYLMVMAQSVTDDDNGLWDGEFYMDCLEVVGSV